MMIFFAKKRFLGVCVPLFTLLILSACGGGGGGSSSSSSGIPNFSTQAQKVLPVMSTAETLSVVNTSPKRRAVSYSTAEWTGTFEYMSQLALSTSPDAGTESVFNLVDTIQGVFDMLGESGGFTAACEAPNISNGISVAVTLTGGQLIALPEPIGASSVQYDCVVTVGFLTEQTSYSFAYTSDLKKIAYTSKRVLSTETAYDVFEGEYDSGTGYLNVDFSSYSDKDVDFAMRAQFSGYVGDNTFTFASTLRSAPSDTPENEAKKLYAKGISQGSSSYFIIKADRKNELSGGPYYFCIDASTKSLNSTTTNCSAYETDAENASFIPAVTVPYAPFTAEITLQ